MLAQAGADIHPMRYVFVQVSTGAEGNFMMYERRETGKLSPVELKSLPCASFQGGG
jgi:hypothetical protein